MHGSLALYGFGHDTLGAVAKTVHGRFEKEALLICSEQFHEHLLDFANSLFKTRDITQGQPNSLMTYGAFAPNAYSMECRVPSQWTSIFYAGVTFHSAWSKDVRGEINAMILPANPAVMAYLDKRASLNDLAYLVLKR